MEQPSAPPANASQPNIPAIKSNSTFSLLWIAAVAIFLGTTIVLAYQNFQLQKQISALQAPSFPTPTNISDPTANWFTYTNTKYKYSLKYPASYIAGQNGVSTSHPETVNFLSVYNGENPDKPRFAISVWTKSQASDLEKRAADHYQEMSTYKLPIGFSLYQGTDNEAVKAISQETFRDLKSFRYVIKGNYVEDGAAEYITPIQNHVYIWFESGNNIFLISLDDEVLMNQILSTFNFLGQGQTTDNTCTSVNLGLALTLPNPNWSCVVDNLGKEQKGWDGIVTVSSQTITMTITSLGRGSYCNPGQDTCQTVNFYSGNQINLDLYKVGEQNKEVYGWIQNGPSISTKWDGMEGRGLTTTERQEIISLLDSISKQ